MEAKKKRITKAKPVKLELLTILAKPPAITFPKLACFIILIKVADAKIINNILPIPFKDEPKASMNSLLLLIVLAPIPYPKPKITKKIVTTKTNPLLKKEL